MEDKEFRAQYKKEFDNVHASDELRSAVMNLKPQKPRRVVTPFKATIGAVAAAIMIFAAVHDYNFKPDTSGVISETVVSTQLPNAEFKIVEKKKPEAASATAPAKDTGVATPTQKTKPVNAVATTTAPTQAPVATTAPTSEPVAEPAAEDHGIAPFSVDGPSSRSGGAGGGDSYTPPTVEMWTVERYYEYLGTNVSQKIAGRYTGAQSMEFEVGSDGIPLDDTAVLNFVTNSGASVRITVSKHVIFNSALSGTVSEAGGGYNGYKVSNGVYYNIFATNTTHDEVVSIVNSL